MIKTKITYYDNLKIIPKIKGLEEIINYGFLSYDKKETINNMVEFVRDFINQDNYCTLDNFLDRYYFEYEIMIIPSTHFEFENDEELIMYCKNSLCNITKDNLYDFLLSISDFAIEEYDYMGNLIYGTISIDGLNTEPLIYISENDRGCTSYKFKIGDIVIRKNYPNELYKVIFAYDNDFIYPEFPIHYTGTVLIAPLGDEMENSIRYARSELIKVDRDKTTE